MKMNLAAAARIVPLTALMLGACVSQSTYDKQDSRAAAGSLPGGVGAAADRQDAAGAEMGRRRRRAVPGGRLSAQCQRQAGAQPIRPQLQGLHNAKVVVYGYTDNLPVGPALQRAGIANNIDLSSRRADNVVAYLTSQGVDPNIISAKGFGDTHPVASNDTSQSRAQNRRIEIVMEGPGA